MPGSLFGAGLCCFLGSGGTMPCGIPSLLVQGNEPGTFHHGFSLYPRHFSCRACLGSTVICGTAGPRVECTHPENSPHPIGADVLVAPARSRTPSRTLQPHPGHDPRAPGLFPGRLPRRALRWTPSSVSWRSATGHRERPVSGGRASVNFCRAVDARAMVDERKQHVDDGRPRAPKAVVLSADPSVATHIPGTKGT